MGSLRILMVNRGVFPVPPESSGGGAERYAYNLTNHIARQGNIVHFITKARPEASFAPLVMVHYVPPRKAVIPPGIGFFGWIMKHLFSNILCFFVTVGVFQRIKPRSFDVVHCHGGLTALLVSILCGRRVPVVYTVHDGSPWIGRYAATKARLLRKLFYIVIEVPCCRLAGHIVSVSPALRSETIRWGVPPERVTFLPSGIDTPSQLGPRDPSTDRYGLFVGQLVPRKGAHILITAFSKVRNRNLRLVIVGDGPERQRLIQMTENLGLGHTISLPGYVEETKLTELYRHASFFVLPSSAEGLSLAMLEAARYGLPLIISNICAVGLDLTHRKDCLLFSSSDAEELGRLIDMISLHDELRNELSLAAQAFAKGQLSWETVAEKMISLYKKVLNQ